MIPDRVRQILQPLMSPSILWDDINLHVGSLPSGTSLPTSRLPCSLIRRSPLAVTANSTYKALRTVGVTIHRNIYLDSAHADFSTAAGLSLLAHEVVHVQQYNTIPGFEDKYDAAAKATPSGRPWENPYELVAYQDESMIYCSLVAQGYPEGKWKPLGVELWGC